MSELLAYKSAVVLALLLLLFLVERWRPAAPEPAWIANGPRWARNLSLWGCNVLVSLLIVLPVTLYATAHSRYWWSSWVPAWFSLPLDILLLDFWIYWWHRASHRIGLLWRFHWVHHLDQWLDVTSAVRFHFGEVILSAMVRALFVFCFAVPITSVILFESLILILTGFHHSNIRLPRRLEQGLSLVIVTPSIHWVHHHAVQRDTDSNYCAIFSIWDRLFGSRSASHRAPDMVIGLDHQRDKSLPGLLAAPFRREQGGLP
ncbi:MAG: sterol desaturase family protein [Porticoccaceae bacterium]